jgi:hypothetical protein
MLELVEIGLNTCSQELELQNGGNETQFANDDLW